MRLALGLSRISLRLCLERLYQFADLFQMFLQAGLPAKRCRACVRPNAHSVLCHALKTDRPSRCQCRHVVSKKLIHQRRVDRPKVVDRVVVHRHATTNPTVRVMLLAQSRHFSPTAHALQRGVQPKRKQNLWVNRRAASVGAACLDRFDQFVQVLAYNVAPHQSGTVILGQ